MDTSIDRNRITWEVWFQLQRDCKHHKGLDTNCRPLCSESNNSGTVIQEGGHKRCGLPFCNYKSVVTKTVDKRMALLGANKEKLNTPVIEDLTPKRVNGNIIDLSKFISPDAIAYEHANI